MKLLVFLLLPCLSLSELVPGFGKCREFFLNDPPLFTPQLTSVQEICQCLRDNNNQQKYFYATLYSTDWRIPIYSAYVFKHAKVDREDCWYIEPQLEDAKAKPCMACKSKGSEDLKNQAMNSDYIGSSKLGYEKGHLYPVQHTYDEDSMLATSTLTNAAPQNSKFNKGQWCKHEKDVIKDLETCNKAYVVTGVVPDINIPKLKNRVTVSKYYWRATCCLQKNGVITGKGYIGPDNNGKVEELQSITALQDKLARYYNVNTVVIFPGGCN